MPAFILSSRLPEDAPKPGGGRRVLVVDDDPLNRALSILHLREAGFVVDTANCAETALAIVRAAPPDAILSDVQMPGMDGFGLRRVIRGDATLARIPIVLISTARREDPERSPDDIDEPCLLRTPDLQEAIDVLIVALQDYSSSRVERPTGIRR